MRRLRAPKNRNVFSDILLIVLANILFWFLFKEKVLLALIRPYHLDKLLPFIFTLLVSLLYYSVRRWYECFKFASLVEVSFSKDALTNLYHRQALESKLLLEWQRFIRYKEPFCLIQIHIDDLKLINDTFGHQEGDRIIISVSEKLLSNIRKTDFCARWSGSEFLIFCPVSELTPIVALAERLRSDVYCLLKDGVELSISLGVSQSDKAKSVDELLKNVELQLDKAEKNGGNCIVSDADV